MKLLKNLCLLVFLTSLCWACKKNEGNNNSSSTSKVDAMAKEICECKKELADLNEKIEIFTKESKTQEVMDLFKEVSALSNDVAKCEMSIQKKYSGQNKATAESKLQSLCPKVAKMIEKQKAMEQE